MAKKFDIHEWQAKQRLYEMDPQYDGPGGEGKMAKGDAIELAKDAEDVVGMIGPESNLPEWVEAKITKAAEYMNTVKDYLSNYASTLKKVSSDRIYEQEDTELSKDAEKVADHPLIDRINTKDEWIDIMDALMKHADSISQVNDSIKRQWLQGTMKKVGQKDIEELNMTGTGASFNAGSGEGYMSPYAFGDDKRKKRKAYMGYKEI